MADEMFLKDRTGKRLTQVKRETRIEKAERGKIIYDVIRTRSGEERRQFKEKTRKILSDDNYPILKNFVMKYGYNYISNNGNDPSNFLEKVNNFKKLMENKGINLSEDELKDLIKMEIELQEYEEFKRKILYNHPKDLDNYIKNFLDVCGENYSNYTNLLFKLLKENGVTFKVDKVFLLIKSLSEQKKLELFEKELLQFDDEKYIPNLDSLDGYEFEEFLKKLFDKMGFISETTKLSGDQGADIIIKKFGKMTAVQAKRYTGKVTNKAVQEVVASIAHYGADNGMVVTTGEFTASAIELANSNNIELINGEKLEELINKYY